MQLHFLQIIKNGIYIEILLLLILENFWSNGDM